jgi:uncharacterized membrane protein
MTDRVETVRTGEKGSFADAVDRVVLTMSRRWLAALIGYGAVFLVLPVLAPLLKAAGHSYLSTPIYFSYQFICHQQADRSFHVLGEQMAFCARDLAIFAGAVGVALIYAMLRRWGHVNSSGSWLLALAVIPIAVDGITQMIGMRESTAYLRVLTGLIFSAGIGWYLLPRLDRGFQDLTENISARVDTSRTPLSPGTVPWEA